MSALGALMMRRRTELGLDQAALGRQIGVGQQSISRWETGASTPRHTYIAPLADALHIPRSEAYSLAGYAPDVPLSPAEDLVATIRRHAMSMTTHQLSDVIDITWPVYRARTLPVD